MYTSQTQDLKNSILNNNNFESCIVINPSFKGVKLLGSRRVPQSINASNHHIYVDLESYRGNDIWLESDGKKYFFDKPYNENGVNIPLWNSQTGFQIKTNDGRYSQVIGNVDLNHTLAGHSSVYFYASFFNEETLPDPPIEPEVPNPEVPNTHQATLKSIIDDLESIIYRLDELVEKL